ncbi:hypothetical protein DICPUDRAFT_8781, partial [Dictyostelium purpureum]
HSIKELKSNLLNLNKEIEKLENENETVTEELNQFKENESKLKIRIENKDSLLEDFKRKQKESEGEIKRLEEERIKQLEQAQFEQLEKFNREKDLLSNQIEMEKQNHTESTYQLKSQLESKQLENNSLLDKIKEKSQEFSVIEKELEQEKLAQSQLKEQLSNLTAEENNKELSEKFKAEHQMVLE